MNDKKFLTQNQRATLRTQLKKEKDSKLNDRIKCILLLDEGHTYETISKFLFLDNSTIGRYRSTYLEGGIEALIRLGYKGRFTQLSKIQLEELTDDLQKQHHVNAASVANFVRKKWGITYSLRGIRDLLHRIGFCYKKPEKIPAKVDLEAQQQFIDELSEEMGVILHIDAVHPQYNSKPSYGWFPKKKKIGLLSNTGRRRLNIHGALNPKTLEVFTVENENIDGFSTVELLEKIQRAYPSEKMITVVCDNAKYHFSQLVQKYLETSRIKLKFLPPYSPNLNFIERLWKFMHKKVTNNKFYEKFADFSFAIRNFFRDIPHYRREINTLFQKISCLKLPQIILP